MSTKNRDFVVDCFEGNQQNGKVSEVYTVGRGTKKDNRIKKSLWSITTVNEWDPSPGSVSGDTRVRGILRD